VLKRSGFMGVGAIVIAVLCRQPKPMPPCYNASMGYCFKCKQSASKVDNRGEHLTGFLTCNVWWSRWSANAVKLSEEDLHALHELRRTKTPE
jgi:hypothetical protein